MNFKCLTKINIKQTRRTPNKNFELIKFGSTEQRVQNVTDVILNSFKHLQ